MGFFFNYFTSLVKLMIILIEFVIIFYRPGVAGAVLQSPPSLTDSFIKSSFSSNIFKILSILNRKR